MRILQLTVPGASAYELKSQRIDRAALESKGHLVITTAAAGEDAPADVVHVYGPSPLPRAAVRRLRRPWVTGTHLARPRWPLFDRAPEPAVVTSPFAAPGATVVPEAVDEAYFALRPARVRGERKIIGSYAGARPWVRDMAEQTMMRIHRFRDDIDWLQFDSDPTPEDLTGVDVWVDPARAGDDFDGFVAEGLVSGIPVVAARTAVNEARTDKGRTAFLVPPGDSNELTHAILAALFKPEVAHQKVQSARLTASKFRPSQRVRALIQIYETSTP